MIHVVPFIIPAVSCLWMILSCIIVSGMMTQLLQYDSNYVKKWCLDNNIELDDGKTMIISCSHKANSMNFSSILQSVTFTTKCITCPQVTINNIQIPVQTKVKYLGL
jgi:hypothetical protein